MDTSTDTPDIHTTWQCEDIVLSHHKSRVGQTDTHSAANEKDVVRLHFGLRGDYEFTYRQLGKTFDLVGGHHNLMYSKGIDLDIRFKTPEVETFGVQFSRDFFIGIAQNATEDIRRFSDNVLAGKSDLLSPRWGVIDPAIEQVIRQVIHQKFAPELQPLFLLSKSIELLVLSTESYPKSQPEREGILKRKSDREKVIAARDLVNANLHRPPNLNEVARAVGLNEYKLKRGFKEMFQHTIFGYLTEQRLNLAMQYLRDTEKTSAEIGYSLGYATPQHFNNAFKKKFGFTPNSVRKNPD